MTNRRCLVSCAALLLFAGGSLGAVISASPAGAVTTDLPNGDWKAPDGVSCANFSIFGGSGGAGYGGAPGGAAGGIAATLPWPVRR